MGLCALALPVRGQASTYDGTVQAYLTYAQQRAVAEDALRRYGVMPDTGRGPEVDVRLVFPSTQTGLDNIEMTMLEPVGAGAHECMAIAVKAGGTVIESYFHASKDARPGHAYDVVVSDSMGDKFFVGRIIVSREARQQYTIEAPLLTPGSPHYTGPQSAPPLRLGVFGETLTPAVLHAAHIESANVHGVLVLFIWPGSNAQRMGIRPGDVIVAVNGHTVSTVQQIMALESGGTGGVQIAYLRGGRVFHASVGRQQRAASATSSGVSSSTAALERLVVRVPALGMNAIEITPAFLDLVHAAPTARSLRGIVVINPSPNGWAAQAGLQNDDIVTAVNGYRFTTLSEFIALIGHFARPEFSLVRRHRRITMLAGGSGGWHPPHIDNSWHPPQTDNSWRPPQTDNSWQPPATPAPAASCPP